VTEISRGALFGKLNSLLYQGIESATVFCKMRGNSYVELVHWLQQILQLQDSDLRRIVDHFDIEIAHLAADFTKALDRLPRGASSVSDLSSHLEEAVERAWVYGSLMYQSSQIRSGYLLIGILKSRALRNELLGISKEFDHIKIDTLVDQFDKITGGSPEDHLAASDGSDLSSADGAGGAAGGPLRQGEALAKFTVDLTEQARNGELDPIVGRDEEIRQIVDILMRRRQNNPILIGEAGVGKTAVVEGFAMRLVSGDVPPQLKNVALKVLDLGLLQAGASMKGEFEQRLRQIIDEVHASETPIILFIDEAHTLIGAGGQEGTGDAANLLKPALARGTLRTVAATTFAEYKKYIEKDPALTRRFQTVQVGEPSEEKCIRMLRCISPVMERHHEVQVFDEAVASATTLAHRYIPARQLPDKAVSLLDTACARVAVALHATPAPLEDSDHRIVALELEEEILERECAVGYADEVRSEKIARELTEERARYAQLTEKWNQEKELVDQILELRQKLVSFSETETEEGDGESSAAAENEPENSASSEAGEPAEEQQDESADAENSDTDIAADDEAIVDDEATMRKDLDELQSKLTELQGDQPLVFHSVDAAAVASVVEDWTGIPVGSMVKDEIESILNMTDRLRQRVIGQDHGLEMIVSRVQTSRAQLDNPGKPIGVFMLCGPSGVGKTETALALAESLYGGEQNLITINMSEFQEAHTVSTLKGAPPGYVGYGEGGVLTEAVRRRPYSVVLLDEVEKAHPDVHEIFFQVFDKGVMEDGEGRMIDFRNTLILLTSNVGSELIMNFAKDPELMPDPEAIAKALREPQLKIFPAALLGRIVSIPYYPLSDEVLHMIIVLQLGRIRKRMAENHGIPLTHTDAVLELIAARCTELESGGRMIDAILTNTVLPQISRELLSRMAQGTPLTAVEIDAKDDNFVYNFS